MKLQNEGGVDTEGPVSEDEAFIKVLGPEKPSRLRGCGDGLKPPSKRGESINQELAKENEELRKQDDADRECTQSLMRENKELASRLESLESQFSQIPTILQNLSQFVHTPPNNGLTASLPRLSTSSSTSHLGIPAATPPPPRPQLKNSRSTHRAAAAGRRWLPQPRGPLQSSNGPSLRAWTDPSSISAAADHPGAPLPVYSGGIGYAFGYGGFSGFHIPAQTHGDKEEHDAYFDKPSSASSDSRL
ncbi:hypothetical protein PHJA_002757200 [Phtheirospermum japonicum]|uniref:Uncharacterized protein n=1 Tax=Phtheirospermum japonicum TaxID=374723 RepID=A0A830DJJ9_9LAMI|nr:hypothetical protein PHJA_002757200 [Phtheirospermum japonicum]